MRKTWASLFMFGIQTLFAPLTLAYNNVNNQTPSEAKHTELGLSALIQYAANHSPSLASAKSELQIYELKLKNAQSGFLPSIDASLNHGFEATDPGESTTQGSHSELNLSLEQSLYDNGQMWRDYNLAKIRKEKSQLELARRLDTLSLDIAQKYFEYLKLRELLDIDSFEHSVLKQQFISTQAQYRGGETTQTEYLRFKAKYRRSEVSLQGGRIQVAKALEELKALLGWKPTPDKESFIVKRQDLKKLPLSSLRSLPSASQLTSSHIDLKILELDVETQVINIQNSQRRYWPQLTAKAGVQYHQDDALSARSSARDNTDITSSLSLNLKYNLWDWGERRRDLQVSRIEKKVKDLEMQELKLQLKKKISQLILETQLQQNTLNLNQQMVDLESKTYASVKRDFRTGKAAFLDLVNAIDNLTSAKTQYVTNYFQLKSSLVEIQYHKGNLYASLLKN
jgi:outer membrane protein TolC